MKIAPSLLSSDFSRLAEEIAAVTEAGAEWIQVDRMDGHFTPNITIGPPVVARLRQHCTVPMDVHLMLTDPAEYVEAFADSGADIITFHVEAERHPHRLLEKIKTLGCQAGVVLNPGTSHDDIEYLVELVDIVLLMSVNPGFGGQAFIPEVIRKIECTRAMLGDRDLEVDGGIDRETAKMVVDAGANVLVAGSYVFGSDSYMEAIESLKSAQE
ncbi:MAG: ribulose-phosphate 3-epimerase [bacterium]|nr:ribulose-phosphate 3-epimerase [bacterium]